MNIQENINLANYSTMKVGGTARYLLEAENKQDVSEAVAWAKSQKLPILIIGIGSNVIWRDEGFSGLVIINRIKKYEVFKEDETNYYITIGAGENWDSIVERTVNDGLTGIEALSLVPGTAGATPVQNVGAYGQDISQTLTTVEAYDIQNDKFVIIPASECDFGYRTSRFKTADKEKFCIVSITLHLVKGNPYPPFYDSLQSYLQQHSIHEYSPKVIRDAVIAIRSSKLPDPNQVKNVGSFFANPIVTNADYVAIKEKYPTVPNWSTEDNKIKISAAWLIEQCGFKGLVDLETGMTTWPSQPLVLVNNLAKSTEDILKFRDKIIEAVDSKFGITLIQEPELLP